MNPPNPMPDHTTCPQCSASIPANAPGGLCPACLLRQGVGEDTVTGCGKTIPFVPPSIAELASLFPQLEILNLIGKGGMGAVYKARQKELDRVVALKILPPGIGDTPGFAERFSREAKALAKLNHPGIVTIHDFGKSDGLYFFLMEYVDGMNLRQLLGGERIAPCEALAIVPQICDSLQFAHDHGIVHRDIKPVNILIDRRGRVKVADFGLAKLVEAGAEAPGVDTAVSDPGLTEAGKVMGTPSYMAPEQTEHPDEVDHRADIYALGVVFYEMLTGEQPGKQLQPPSLKVKIDVRLDEVVLRALEKNPELRYSQASIFKTQVETITETPRAEESKGEAPVVAPDELKRTRFQIIGSCFWLLVTAAGMSSHLHGSGEAPYRIGIFTWGLLFFVLTTVLTFAAGNNRVKIKVARTVGIIDSFGILGALIWCVSQIPWLERPWLFVIVGVCGFGILFGVGKLFALWKSEQPGTENSKPVCYSALFFAILANLIPMIFYWNAKALPWVTPEMQQAMLWLTLVVAIIAVVLGFLGRPSRVAWTAIVVGGVSLTIWILCFVTGLISQATARQHDVAVTAATGEAEPGAAVNAWLALMDAGDYAKGWATASEVFRKVVGQEKWVTMSHSVRQPLGAVISRKQTSTEKISSLPGMADGPYFVEKFDTSFAGMSAATETVTFVLEKGGQWKAAAYLILPKESAKKEPSSASEKAAVKAAETWLAGIDAGNYAQSWKDAAALFQAAITEEGWTSAVTSARKPLGGLVSRKLKTARYTKSLPGAPDGEYVFMQFDTSFTAIKTSVETVTFRLETDGQWRSVGYLIQ